MSLLLLLAESGTGPAITSQPSSVTCFEDDAGLTMSIVSAEADNFQWQKRRGGVGDWLNISGATSATWNITTTIPTVTAGDTIRCRAGIGSAYTYSSEVTLKIWPNFPVTPHSWWHGVGAAFFEERTAGGSTASSVGGVVGTWRDRSGNSRHFAATGDTARPLLQSDGSLLFDGVNDAMQAATAATWAFMHNGSSYTMFIVAEVIDADPEAFYLLLATRSGGSTSGFLLGHDTRSSVPRSNALAYSVADASAFFSVNMAQPDNTTPTQETFLAGVRSDPDATSAFSRASITTNYDEYSQTINTSTNAPTATNSVNTLTLGAGANASSTFQFFAKIKVREVAIFNSLLSDGDYDEVRIQLMERHGISYTKRNHDDLFGSTSFIDTNALSISASTMTPSGSNPIIGSNALDKGTDINYGVVIREAESSYKFWYGAAKLTTPKRICFAYAPSDDGLSLDATSLGLVTIDGNTNNNCIGADGWWNLSPWRQQVGGKYVACLEATNALAGTGYGKIYDSPDGTTWTERKDLSSVVGSYFEQKDIIQRRDGRWMVYYIIGHASSDREVGLLMSRTSDYTGTWDNIGSVITTSAATDQKYSVRVFWTGRDFYAAIAAYNSTSEQMDQDLYRSLDGVTWTRLVNSWVPLGAGGSWDDEQNFCHLGATKDGNNWRHYLAAAEEDHAWTDTRNSKIGIWTTPYRGIYAATGTGDLVTTLVAPSDNTMYISCSVTTSLKVELLDGITGEVLDGYSVDDCDTITSGVQEVTWNGLSSPGGLLKVKFVAVSATVYSYWFGDVGL